MRRQSSLIPRHQSISVHTSVPPRSSLSAPLTSLDHDSASFIRWRKNPASVRRVLYAIILTGIILSLGWRHRGQRKLKTGRKRQLVIRSGGLTNEGIGSALQHFKESILFAQLLDRDLVLAEQQSEHKYQISELFNRVVVEHGTKLQLPLCTLEGRALAADSLDQLVKLACDYPHEAAAVRGTLARMFDGCGTIMHVVTTIPLEERFNGCISPWLKRTLLGPVCGRRGPPRPPSTSGVIRVGVHMRWGDVAPKNLTEVNEERAMAFPDINDVVASVSKCGRPVRVRVYAENFSEEARQYLDFHHELVDSGDDIEDLCSLSDNDVIIAGGSSYAVLAVQMSYSRLAVITNHGAYKYKDTDKPGHRAIDMHTWRKTEVCDYLN